MQNKSALYIHIPFCDHKCIYCDFYSIITSDNIESFFNSIKKEIQYYSEIYSKDRIFSSIFFGGGTPSLMSPKYIHQILDELINNFEILPEAEITLETNPGTVNLNKLIEFKLAGINRVSIGIQSFDDNELKFLTRIHDKETAISTVNSANRAGFDNISIDLIFNLPSQSKEKWQRNLDEAVKLPIKHISAYSLILERGTILNKMVLDGKVKIQDQDYDAELYETTIDFLSHCGFLQYEVSNFAKTGFECSQNIAYWEHKEYLGFGTSAHSFIGNKRWWNFSSLKKYISEVENNHQAKATEEILRDDQLLEEYIMLTLRSKGLNIEDLSKKFGTDWINKKYGYFESLEKENFLKISNQTISLTKKGYAVCDEILKNVL